MTEPKPLGFHDYLEIALRRKWYLIIPLIVCILGSFGVYKFLPKVYRATTLILVQPQSVPEDYVRPTITESVVSRLNTISQEILSRTRLERVIEEFNLYPDLRKKAPKEEVIETMRRAIEVKVQEPRRSGRDTSTNSFTISFEGEDPQIVMQVTNKLASLFIEENLKVRETQAERTSEFISRELASLEEQLKKKEQDIRNFKERSMGQLPQQLDANLRILERLQQQLQTTSENMRAAEDRAVILQNQIEQLKKREPVPPQTVRRVSIAGQEVAVEDRGPQDPIITQYNNLKRDLEIAQSRYKETHPDVIDLKKKIANLEPKVKELIEKYESEREEKLRKQREGIVVEQEIPPPAPDPNTERLLAQYTEQYNSAVLEAKRSREEIKNLKEQIAFYQKRIEDTPKKEQELALLTRDYDLLKANYQSLLDKKIQAQMAENLERKQQGEQFKVLDPARLPEKPVKPDRNRILLIGAFIGLALGVGLTWFRESMDRSFHTVSEVENYLGISVIAAIPNLKEDQKRKAA